MSSFERVPRSRLTSLELIAKGGQARIHRVEGFALADAPGPLAFKEYHDKKIPIIGLDRLASFRQRLSDQDRAVLDVLANWPLRVVEGAAGNTDGVLLPLLEPTFFFELRLPSGAREHRPRDGEFFPAPRERCELVGVPLVGLGDRFRFCRDLSFAVGFLHKREICLGDISLANITYSLELHPCVYLVDCDAFRLKGQAPVVPQLHTPDWMPPEGPRVQSAPTDLYKLGLFVLRALTPRAQSGQNRDPSWADSTLDPRGRHLLRRALGADPRHRTSAKEWFQYFADMLNRKPLARTSHRSRMPTAGVPVP